MEHSPGFLAVVKASQARVREVSIEETERRMKENPKAILLDVREDSEWQQGHLKNSMHLGRGVLERDIEKLIPDKGRELLLLCGGGYRSALAADTLQTMGYTNAFSIQGGFKAFKTAGREMEAGT